MTDEFGKRIDAIEERNKRVELDKAWEVSATRRVTIAILTYIFAALWLLVISERLALRKAVIPVAGYSLSTVSIDAIRSRWMLSKASRNAPDN